MIIPLWAIFGLSAAALSALMMLLQEKLRVDGFAVAFWSKVACAGVTLPLVVINGLPSNPLFYMFLGMGAVLYAISDVVFFRSIPKVGAGMVSRILPIAVLLTFLIWFVVRPELIDKYAAAPVYSVAIFLVLCLSTWFATHLRNCPVSMQAVKTIWFVLFAATIGPLIAKLVTGQADIGQGPYAYVFVEALMMLSLWNVFFLIRRPIPAAVLFSRHSCLGGLAVGVVMAGMVLLNVLAFYNVDNPAYIPAVKFLDSFIILAVYAMTGRKSEGNVVAGLGIVVCAAALIILKAQI